MQLGAAITLSQRVCDTVTEHFQVLFKGQLRRHANIRRTLRRGINQPSSRVSRKIREGAEREDHLTVLIDLPKIPESLL